MSKWKRVDQSVHSFQILTDVDMETEIAVIDDYVSEILMPETKRIMVGESKKVLTQLEKVQVDNLVQKVIRTIWDHEDIQVC